MPVRGAFRKLMSEVAAADSLPAVYRSALDCLQAMLDVERASVLVFDAERKMRFVAWSRLSAECRAAVDGHSPWTPDDVDARPYLVRDVLDEPSLAAHRPLFEQEGIRALAFVPLRFGAKLLGTFMLYYAEPHQCTEEEVATAELIAGHIAYALEHHRIAQELEARLDAERELRDAAQREAGLRERNERRLHLALGAGRMGAWEWDIGSGRVEWSAELETIHGIEPGTFRGSFAAFRSEVHPSDLARVEQAIAAALQSPQSGFDIEYRIVPPDQVPRWLAAKGRVLVDAAGRPERMVGICSDVTERKRVEEARAFLADASRILATTLDPQQAVKNLARIVVPRLADWCVVQVVNGSGGVTPVEVAHRDAAKVELAWSIVRAWRRAPDAGIAAEVVRTGRPSLLPRIPRELFSRYASGEEHMRMIESLALHSAVTVPLQARGRVLGALSLIAAESQRTYGAADVELAGEIASWAALALDNAQLYAQAEEARAVADRRRRQLQALAAISDELATALEPETALQRLAAHAVHELADYCITYTSDGDAIRRVGFGHSVPGKAALVQAMSEAGEPHIDDASGVGAVVRTGEAVLASDITPEMLEASAVDELHRAALLALAPRSAIIVPLRARGRTLGAVTLAATADSGRHYDVDDLRIATELANRAALLVDNARLYAEARSAVQARDDMITVVSHDLRNPLQSIAAAAALLRLDPPAERKATSLESIALASAQMAALIQDLLDISRMDAGQFSVARESTDVAALITETQTLFQPQAEGKGVRLECRVEPGLPLVAADRARTLQVISNLLGNAMKFVAAGGSIALTAERHGELVRITVRDSGIGIAAEHLDRVFDRFWRADRRKERGAGLGLALAKGIVEAHGGTIGVESRLGEGSTFYFTLRTQPGAAMRVEGVLGSVADRRAG